MPGDRLIACLVEPVSAIWPPPCHDGRRGEPGVAWAEPDELDPGARALVVLVLRPPTLADRLESGETCEYYLG
jgi:hypothetical protein